MCFWRMLESEAMDTFLLRSRDCSGSNTCDPKQLILSANGASRDLITAYTWLRTLRVTQGQVGKS